jgi:hypothetical protein
VALPQTALSHPHLNPGGAQLQPSSPAPGLHPPALFSTKPSRKPAMTPESPDGLGSAFKAQHLRPFMMHPASPHNHLPLHTHLGVRPCCLVPALPRNVFLQDGAFAHALWLPLLVPTTLDSSLALPDQVGLLCPGSSLPKLL